MPEVPAATHPVGTLDPSPPVASSQSAKIALALGTVYVVWGSTYFAIRVAIESIPPLLMAGTRFVLAGILMITFARWWQRVAWPTRRQWRDAAVVGACLLLVGNGGVTLGERHIPSGLAAMLVATVPMFMGLFGWWSGRTPRPGAVAFLSMGVGFTGVCLLVHPGSAPTGSKTTISPTDFSTGVALLLLAAAVWAAGSLYAKHADRPASAVLNIGAQMLCGGVLLGVAAVLRGESLGFHPGAITAHSASAFCYLVFVGALVGFSAYIWVLGAASPTLVGTYAFVNPGVAVLLGWAFAGEAFSATTLLGMVIILSAVALIVLFPPRTASSLTPSATALASIQQRSGSPP